MQQPSPLVLARLDLLDGLRNRRQLIVRAITPVALLVGLVVLLAFSGDNGTTTATTRYLIAVEGDVDGALTTIDALRANSPTPLEFVSTDNLYLALVDGADAGLRLPDDLDAAMATSAPPPLTLITSAEQRDSRAAGSQLRAAFAASTLPLTVPLTVDTAFVDPETEEEDDLQTALGQVAAALVLLQGGVLVGTSAARFTSKRATGTLVPQLLLPVARSRLVLGRGIAEMVLGLLAGIPILGLVAVAVVVTLVATGDIGLAVLSLVLLFVTAVAVFLPLVAVGLTVGARTKSTQQASALTAGGLVVVALTARFVALLPDTAPGWVVLLPLAGPAKVLRDTISGDVQPGAMAVAFASTALISWLIVRVAARSLDRDDMALRMT